MILRDGVRKQAQWTADYWLKKPGGGAIDVDVNPPTTTPPSADRIVRAPARFLAWRANNATNGAAQGPFLAGYSQDGTAISLRYWWHEEGQNIWVPFTQGITLTTANNNIQQLSIAMMHTAKWFFQVTANTGVTKLAFIFR